MKKIYNNYFSIQLTRHDGLALMEILKEDTHLSDSVRERLKRMVNEGIKPFYEYQVKCSDCGKSFTVTFGKKLTQDEIELAMGHPNDGLGILCSSCLDDYK